jgi:sigma-B regulation protein RsbU (phosphoserine phosphatase)
MESEGNNGAATVHSASVILPAGEADTGGYFALVRVHGSKTVALVGDVEGNGREAAPYAERLCEGLERDVASADPVGVLEKLNHRVYRDPAFDRFVTACVVVIDHVRWSAHWAFAGHLPPHWLDTGLPLDGATPGVPLGVDETCGAVSAEQRPLRPGQGMLLFTDGLEDVKGPGGDRFGSARITHTLARRLNGASPEEVVDVLKAVACDFGDGRLPDDLCLVVLRVT